MNTTRPLALIIMGVSGCGKTTVGKLLSQKTGIPFTDADDHHPPENIEKMRSGIPLDDSDRHPWLQTLHQITAQHLAQNQSCIIACSALKASYRRILDHRQEHQVKFIFLEGTKNIIENRLNARNEHFMNPGLLTSQFETLEFPPEAARYSIDQAPEAIADQIWKDLSSKAEFGVIGLGVMGRSISRNLASNRFRLALYNREIKGAEEGVARKLVSDYPEMKGALPFNDLKAFVNALESPRKILLMVPSGEPVADVISELTENLHPGDIIVDGGNSHYRDSERHQSALHPKGIRFLGCGISGGEKGALTGPSLMPGGDAEAYTAVRPFLLAMAAKDTHGNACCTYLGKGGSGHFAKIIHNGIEYAEMQLLAEVYHLFKRTGASNSEIHNHFCNYNEGKLSGYLLEITCRIFEHYENGELLLDHILDKAGNKGTGSWATIAAAASGTPATMIGSALFARYLSFFKERREKLELQYRKHNEVMEISPEDIGKAYTLARIINHLQGFDLLAMNGNQYRYPLSEVARIWTQGCIIRSKLMEQLSEILKTESDLFFSTWIKKEIQAAKPALEKVVAKAITSGIAVPVMSDAINYLHGITTGNGPANLIQAQRDYFGAHRYQKINDPSQEFYHTPWEENNELS